MASPVSHLESSALRGTIATPVHRLGIDGRPVPRLRGRIHEAMIVPMTIAGVAVAVSAPTSLEQVAIGIFTLSTVAMLTASAAYHCHAHTMDAKLSARRLDHTMIFVAIAGAQTAYLLLTAPPAVGVGAIIAVWLIAAVGIHHKLNKLTLEQTSGSWLYVALGWTGLAMTPFLVEAGDLVAIAAVIGGGLVYTGGGAVLSRRLIDPWPAVFGYHEVWHLMVVIGVTAHFVGIVRLVAISV